MNQNPKKIFFFSFFFFISILKKIFGGIIQPDDVLPLEIIPSYPYDNDIGEAGTKFIFRFYIPNNLDRNGMPTLRGYGASNGQYLGIKFNLNNPPFTSDILQHSCQITQITNNLEIPIPSIPESSTEKTIYCKINSFHNVTTLLPGNNYKVIITFTSQITGLSNLLSITVFTSTAKDGGEIIDTGTFNHINIIPSHNFGSPLSPVVSFENDNTPLDVEVESPIEFTRKITFNYWFSWEDYIIVLDLPQEKVITENAQLIISNSPDYPGVGVPLGTMNSINLESNEKRKHIGFYLDHPSTENILNDRLLLTFKGLKTSESGLINENDNENENNNFIRIEIRYRNSYVICGSTKIIFHVSLGNVEFTIKHPETDGTYVFDVFRGGAFQIEFTIKSPKKVTDKYILIRQKDTNVNKRVTFIASSCDFSNYNITSMLFNEIPKCYPIKNKNIETGEDNNNGIFFYYPSTLQANTEYKLKVWMFFDECGPEQDSTSSHPGGNAKVEIQFYLEMYSDIDKNKIGENRFSSKYIFMNKIDTSEGIKCYNTFMGEKNYQNGYIFKRESYGANNKLLYREYFNWNLYDSDIENDIFNKNIYPKFIYSKSKKIEAGKNLYFVNKITLDSGNNEKLSGFFPMGLIETGGKISAIKGKFFMKLSKSFFAQKKDENGNPQNCYVSWNFGSPSITDTLSLVPQKKFYPKQKYNFITNSKDWFIGGDDPTVLINSLIETIKDNSLESKKNEGWDESAAEWSFGDDENLEDQISDDAPVDIYFGLSDTCHYWTNLKQTITSLYTPIEIIIGITAPSTDTTDYSRVMRFIKLFPEGGVWQDNMNTDNPLVSSSDFIIKNHYAFNQYSNVENNLNEKGVCLLEIAPGILEAQRYSSNVFILWVFLGSLLDSDYDIISSTYPIGNLHEGVKSYGYSSQHSLHINNFYAKSSPNQKSDISSPIYNIATSMNSIYQSATSGYLFYLGSLIVFFNRGKSSLYYKNPSQPLLIPYYCPYYISDAEIEPYSLGVFPSFIGAFGSFESMTNLGSNGFDRLVAKKINNKQLNLLMLSGIKIATNNNIQHFYNTVKFFKSASMKTLDIWNCDKDFNTYDGEDGNDYDSIDSFIFLFNKQISDLYDNDPGANNPSSLKSLSKSKREGNCFYVYGKKFCSGLFGLTNSFLYLTKDTPNIKGKIPYLSINLNFEITQDLFRCQNSDKFCLNDLIAFWGISSNHDNIRYVTNYDTDSGSYLIDFNIYRTYYDNTKTPTCEIGQDMALKNDPAIYLKITFNSPFETPILSNTILSFYIREADKAQCSVQSINTNMPSSNCETDSTGKIKCQLVDTSDTYTIFCYKIQYGNGKYTLHTFRLYLPNEESTDLGPLFFEDMNEYLFAIPNTDKELTIPEIQYSYVTIPYNPDSYSKLELKINLKRPAHPGMEVNLFLDELSSFTPDTICIFRLSKINSYSLDDISMDEYWTEGNAIIYNCEIENIISQYKIKAKLDNKIYKIGNPLSDTVYIYIWPFKVIQLSNIKLYVTINGNIDILDNSNPTGIPKEIAVSNVNPFINNYISNDAPSSCIDLIQPTSKLLGDLSDYLFKMKFNALSTSISAVQIFFPKEIDFECEECVKCYEIDSYEAFHCHFEDINILNIFFGGDNSNTVNILITGVINPKESLSLSTQIYINFINEDSLGNRCSYYSGVFDFNSNLELIEQPNDIKRLRFFYYQGALSDKNPRNEAEYTFRISFDYANENSSPFPTLLPSSYLYIYFPRDYHLYINKNPNVKMNIKYMNDVSTEIPSFDAKILGTKLRIIFDSTMDPVKIKYIEIIIKKIKNPNKIISTTENKSKNKYTGYFKIVCINRPDDSLSIPKYYYITGINSNTYRSDYITDDEVRTDEFNWYRGNLIQTDYVYRNKLIIDVLYNEKTYDFLFLQPGRYTKVHFVTSSDNEYSEDDYHLYPDSTKISFPTGSDSIVVTLEEEYVVPSLFGEPYEFYIGVPCSTPDGIYIVSPIIENSEQYILPPTIIVNVRQIEKANIKFIQDDISISPMNAKVRVYYYLSDINVDILKIRWEGNNEVDDKEVDYDTVFIPGKTYTDYAKRISNVFSTITIKRTSEGPENPSNNFYCSIQPINRCYELLPNTITIRESRDYGQINFDHHQNYKLSEDLVIENSEIDGNLLSNEIKLAFNDPLFVPTFIICELYCRYQSGDNKNSLLFYNYDSIPGRIKNQNYFRKYASKYFYHQILQSSSFLIFSDVIKGYQYNVKCLFQTTDSDQNLIRSRDFTLLSNYAYSVNPAKTRCNTFYFISPLSEENQQKYINYCQYIMGKNLGYTTGGCVICTDCSGKIIAPGYELYFPFSCQKEKCYSKRNSSLVDYMYDLAEEFNTYSNSNKYEFTICASSNRICPSQIEELPFNSAFNQFVDNIKTRETVNRIFNYDNSDNDNYIIYNGYFQNMIYIESTPIENDISIEFLSEFDKSGKAIWKASYNSEVNFNILCFWRIKISTDQIPTMEEMTNCLDDESFCGIFVANYGGHIYEIPSNKKSNVVVGEYTFYITCSYFVPSPIYFTSIKSVITFEIKEEEASLGKILRINNLILFLFLILYL